MDEPQKFKPEESGSHGSNDYESDYADSTGAQEFDDELGDEIDEDEFSLDTLSQVYAQVLRQNQPLQNTFDGGENHSNKSTAVNESLNEASIANDASDPTGASRGTKHIRLESEGDLQETDDNANCPIIPESIVEAILFVGCPIDEKLTAQKIAAKMRDVSPKEINAIVKKLNQRYEKEGAVYRIRSEGGHLFMELDAALRSFQRAVAGKDRPAQLSQSAVEVLAIVAYNQPISKARVEELRKRPSGSLLNQLTGRGLLTIHPHPEQIASAVSMGSQDRENVRNLKQKHYATTDRFLELMNLDSIDDLPQSHEVDDLDEMLGGN